jgi:hypothetical protein
MGCKTSNLDSHCEAKEVLIQLEFLGQSHMAIIGIVHLPPGTMLRVSHMKKVGKY